MTRERPTVGQRVILVPIGYNARHRNTARRGGTVVTVRRTLFGVQIDGGSSRPIDFRLETFAEQSDFPGWRVYLSEQEIIDEQEMSELTEILRKTFGGWGRSALTLDQLRRISAITKEVME